jgi:replicative DNA helicase
MAFIRDGEQLWSIEAEAATLGSMLIDPECIPKVAVIITKSEMFYKPEHRLIFDALLMIHIDGKKIDAVILRTKLKQRKQLKAAGGVEYIKQILESVPSSANAEYYAGVVRERYNYRNLLRAVDEIRKIPDEQGDTNDFIEKIQKIALDLQIEKPDVAFTFKDQVAESLVSLADQRHSIETGFSDLDRIIGGFYNYEFIIVAGRPGMGKSVFAGDVALHGGKQGKKIIIFSLEMSAESLAQRSVCAIANVDGFGWHNDPPQEEFDKAIEASALIQEYDVTIYETIETAEKMYAITHAAQRASGLDLVIVDNIQLMQTTMSVTKEYERLSTISRQLKKIAHELKVPVLCISHLNREVDKRTNHRPRLSDLRGSGTIEQDADLVIMLHREDQYRKLEEPDLPESELDGIAEVTVAKNRRGKTGVCKLMFLEKSTHFVNLAKKYLGEE